MEDPGLQFIKCFCSCGPKNYSFSTNIRGSTSGKDTVCKVKGISLNFRNMQHVNMDTMTEFVKAPNMDKKVTVHEPHRITRNLKEAKLESKPFSKDYRAVFTKRVLQKDYNSYPYGW